MQHENRKIDIGQKEKLTNNALKSFYNAKMKNAEWDFGMRIFLNAATLGLGASEICSRTNSIEFILGSTFCAAGVLGTIEANKYVKYNGYLIRRISAQYSMSKEEKEKRRINKKSLQIFDSLRNYNENWKNFFNIYRNSMCFLLPVTILSAKNPINFDELSILSTLFFMGSYVKYKGVTTKSKMKRVIKENPDLNKEYKLEDIMNDR